MVLALLQWVATMYSFVCEAFLSRRTSRSAATFAQMMKTLTSWAAVQDLMTFFAAVGVAPIGVQITLNAQGRKSGEAYVQFATPIEGDFVFFRLE